MSFHSFQFRSRRASPERARAGNIVCKKSQLKNFSDMKTAGGCGVVRFLYALVYFSWLRVW
ncbi:TPA_asm: hypothetical protein G0P65_09385 [Salmonella enterica subsp. enterica serovar Typhimurium]|uniref:Uncharacterized protein n=1 Tax=Salmonella typhimurium TaxID=90371 RepID=A0A701E761_SALTM|nr:hypothetical protein [Salmonella enterica]ECI2447891.1 hypothetical protein [Salmonella enterica subsp. enterica serovar Typhimurium]ECI5354247.1 hypothetical protein [Salmonella enterica subsp. enterica]EAR0017487.1 hypothetical protein [Salmonella enterica]EAS6389833.1 hypothetical protein [Salmonella enterica]